MAGDAYGRWRVEPRHVPTTLTPLRQQIAQLQPATGKRLINPGTGSTWKALAERKLVEVEDILIDVGSPRLDYYLPHVRLTRDGRRQARQLTGEVRPPAKPREVVAEASWKALAALYSVGSEGLVNGRSETVGRLNWEVLGRLERRKPPPLVETNSRQVVMFYLTPHGRAFYAKWYTANLAAHPQVMAPVPKPADIELVKANLKPLLPLGWWLGLTKMVAAGAAGVSCDRRNSNDFTAITYVGLRYYDYDALPMRGLATERGGEDERVQNWYIEPAGVTYYRTHLALHKLAYQEHLDSLDTLWTKVAENI